MKAIPVLLALACLAVGSVAGSPARGKDAARIMSHEQYAGADRPVPYVLEYGAGEGRLLLVGIAHTLDTNSDTVALIWSEFGRFEPTVAFYEGTDWTPGFSPEIVGTYGEAAVVRFLASANRVPATSIEPDLVDEIDHLRKSWSDEQIKLFYTLRFVAERSGYGGAPVTDAEVADTLSEFFPPTIGGPPLTLEELGNSYGKHFPAGTAWRSVPLDWFSPLTRGRYSNDMARASGRLRDESMLARIVGRVRSGDRVFAAVGSTHAYMLEPALTEALGKPAAGPDGP